MIWNFKKFLWTYLKKVSRQKRRKKSSNKSRPKKEEKVVHISWADPVCYYWVVHAGVLLSCWRNFQARFALRHKIKRVFGLNFVKSDKCQFKIPKYRANNCQFAGERRKSSWKIESICFSHLNVNCDVFVCVFSCFPSLIVYTLWILFISTKKSSKQNSKRTSRACESPRWWLRLCQDFLRARKMIKKLTTCGVFLHFVAGRWAVSNRDKKTSKR